VGTRVGGNSIVNGESFFVFYLIGFRGKNHVFFTFNFFGGKLRVKGMKSDKLCGNKKREDLIWSLKLT